MGPYALFQPNRQGNGIRPRPYSRNMEIQPFTYDSIKTNGWLNGTSLALPHGLGHGWAAILWDMNWDLIDKHGFNPQRLRRLEHGRQQPRASSTSSTGSRCRDAGPACRRAGRRSSRPRDAPRRARTSCTLWAALLPPRAGLQRRAGHDEPRRQHRGVRHESRLPRGLHRRSGRAVRVAEQRACRRRRHAEVPGAAAVRPGQRPRRGRSSPARSTARPSGSSSQFPPNITPREFPIPTKAQGQTKLTQLGGGQFRYRWQTDVTWKDTCREFVLTREDGKQHRAFFSFR